MDIAALLNPDGTPKFVYYYRTRPEILIEVRDGKELLYNYSLRVGYKPQPLTEFWRRVMVNLMKNVYFRDDPALLQGLLDTLPAFIKRYEMKTRMIEVLDMTKIPGPKYPKGSISVHGVEITPDQQAACMAVMRGHFKSADVVAAARDAGVPAKVASLLVGRLLRRERDKGNLRCEGRDWYGEED